MPDFTETFEESSSSTSIILEDGKIDKIITGAEAGTGIRTIKGWEIDYSYENAGGLRPDAQTGPSIDSRISLLHKADKAARSASNLIKQVTVSYGDKTQLIKVKNSDGVNRSDSRSRTRFVINVIAEKDGVIQTGYETFGNCIVGTARELPLPNLGTIESLAKKAAERAIMMLSAPHAPSGEMSVIIMSEAGGTLIHEACGHGLEADFIYKGISVYAGKLGQKVASELVTVIDDATIPNAYGSFGCDDEGTPSQKKVLIENGVLRGYMSDIYFSKLLGIKSSGNGRRENYTLKPHPRMTNTYIEKGKTDPKEIISSINEGLLVKKLGGGQVNVTNGDFVFDVQEGYLVKAGKIETPVRGAMLIGNGPKILEEIDMVGNDLNFITGTCGKGDHAPVTDAMPTVRIPQIVVGGRN
ncbi:MAG: TldD/PmbA family protein [Candidatus Margulisiibacteriota bacterium]